MNNPISTKSLTIWRFIDGKIGHEKQSQALIEGLAKQIQINLFNIKVERNQFIYWISWIFNQKLATSIENKPDIVIGAGHNTHLPLLATKRYYGCKALVIMKPSLPFWFFDYVVAPEHDFLERKKPPNVISTLTALAPYIDSQPKQNEGLILLGGTSKHFDWVDHVIGKKIKNIITSMSCNINWSLSTSRRTPPLTLLTLKKLLADIDNITLLDHKNLSNNWLEVQLQTSSNIIITADSVSMIAEALNTKANIYVVDLPSKKSKNKIEHTLSLLKSKKIIEADNQKNFTKKNRSPLNQQDKCAEIILEKHLQHEL